MGSSPRVRGTSSAANGSFSAFGLIPAGAGNISNSTVSPIVSWAHPRGCGEHYVVGCARGRGLGSSPRVRGTSDKGFSGGGRAGLIPAGAGNMSRCDFCLVCWGAHPRGCGEHVCSGHDVPLPSGSSPRVRGTCLCYGWPSSSPGLIPAGAGNILSDMGFYPHTSSFSISLKPITYFQEYTICSPAS